MDLLSFVILAAALAAAAGVALWRAKARGKAEAKREQKQREQDAYINTRKKVDEAAQTSPTDPDVAREWLRRRSKR